MINDLFALLSSSPDGELQSAPQGKLKKVIACELTVIMNKIVCHSLFHHFSWIFDSHCLFGDRGWYQYHQSSLGIRHSYTSGSGCGLRWHRTCGRSLGFCSQVSHFLFCLRPNFCKTFLKGMLEKMVI